MSKALRGDLPVVSYQTEDGKRVETGDLVYDYYSMEPVRIGADTRDGWFEVHTPDGCSPGKSGILNGARICTMKYARTRGFPGA